MQDIQIKSGTIQRRATLRLEQLTSLVEKTKLTTPLARKAQPPVPPRKRVVAERLAPAQEEDEGSAILTLASSGGAYQPSQGIPSSRPSVRSKDLNTPPQTPLSTPQKLRASQAGDLPTSPMSRKVSSEATATPITTLSVEKFEEEITLLLSSAHAQRMGVEKPFSDDVILRVGGMLSSMEKHTWSERPRTYLVLRLINEVRTMDTFVFEGFKDIDFLFTEKTIPKCIRSTSSRHYFLQKQRYVMSSRSVDLVQGGRHHHLGN
jgi:hypothetical protein